jgi:hypothetical protein
VDSDIINESLTRYSAFLRHGEKLGHCMLFMYFKKAYDSVRREVLYNILIEFGIPMKIG